MGGVARFLLGGALGAALGFFILRKKPQNMPKSAQPLPSPGEAPAAAPWAEEAASMTAVVPEMAVEPEVQAMPEPVLEVPLHVEAAPEAEPVAEAEVAPLAQPLEAEAAWEVPFAPVDEPAIEGPVADEAPVAPQPELAPPSVEASEFEAALAEVATESEIIVTPELLEEPLPGAGWEPTATLAGEEQTFEEILPLVPEDSLPYAPPEAFAEGDREPTWPGGASTEPEVGPIKADAGGLDHGSDLAETTEVGSPAGPAAADDLRARIEETRRRIRQELEQPFMAAEGVPAAEEMVMEPTPEPTIGEALMEQPLVDGELTPSAEESGTPLADPSPSSGVAEGGESRQEPALELGVDYDAMRNRIETTRSRLKAKAFDAMMTGEAALLGRDSADSSVERPAPADVDTEIVETIETTLREEED